MSLSEILTNKRKEYKYSQKQVSDLLQVSQSTYCDWETGQVMPKIENLIKISKLYDMEIGELLEINANFNIINSPNSINLHKSPNSKIETSEAILKVADSLDKLAALIEKMYGKI